jgi:outer membrane protein assembly factor BamB
VTLSETFPQWRGPARTGTISNASIQPDVWGQAGPKLLWEVEDIPGDNKGGFSCVSVAGGRAVLFVNEKYRVPFEHRTITEETIKELGGILLELPDELVKKIEAVRTDKRVLAMERRGRNKYIDDWISENVPEQIRKDHGRSIRDRIRDGADALSVEYLEKLEAMKGKRQSDDEAMKKTLREAGFNDKQIEETFKAIATYDEKAWDWIYCWDAEDGKELWSRKYVGKAHTWPTASTPALAMGRVYVAGSEGQMYCINLATGEEIWKVSLPTSAGINSSPVVHDGRVYIQCHGLTALDAETGSQLWRAGDVGGRSASPVLWSSGGTDYLICHTGSKLACVNAADGQVAWSVPGGDGPSTPVVVGDIAALQTNRNGVHLGAWKLSPTGASLLWKRQEPVDRGASCVAYDGYVYTVAKTNVMCVNLRDGQVAWNEKIRTGQFSSPLVADGKLLAFVRNELLVLDASPSGFRKLAEPRLRPLRCTSPVVAGDRLYLRKKDSVACYDLTQPGTDKQ